jgi:hypothetical protein
VVENHQMERKELISILITIKHIDQVGGEVMSDV